MFKAGDISKITVIGGGLAGCEAAWQAAGLGVEVDLYEMRPLIKSGVHHGDHLGELVCTDYLGPKEFPETPFEITLSQTLLREELRAMGSLIMDCADNAKIDTKKYFAVNKTEFAEKITSRISSHPLIKVIKEEIKAIPEGPAIISTGPLTSCGMAGSISEFVGPENFFGFESSAPLIHSDSIDRSAMVPEIYTDENGTEHECLYAHLKKDVFEKFHEALTGAVQTKPHVIEKVFMDDIVLPKLSWIDHLGGKAVETLDKKSLLEKVLPPADPRSYGHVAEKPYAVLKLIKMYGQDAYKMLGFQTKLKYGEQKRVFSMIPGLENANFIRYGHMHLSCYINSGQCLPTLQHKNKDNIFFAGEIAGTDTYLAAAGTGWIAGQNAARFIKNEPLLILPQSTMFGALCFYLAYCPPDKFQPICPTLFLLRPAPANDDLSSPEKIKSFYEKSLAGLRRYLAE